MSYISHIITFYWSALDKVAKWRWPEPAAVIEQYVEEIEGTEF